MDFRIREMETDDEIKGRAYVHWKAWQETYPGLVDPSYLKALTPEKCEEIARRSPENTLIAKDGERVIGFAVYGECRDADLRHTGELQAIYVLAEYYGKGPGQALMREALSRMREYPRIAVWVLKGNERAIRFYEKYGFRYSGKEKEIRIGVPAKEIQMILEQ